MYHTGHLRTSLWQNGQFLWFCFVLLFLLNFFLSLSHFLSKSISMNIVVKIQLMKMMKLKTMINRCTLLNRSQSTGKFYAKTKGGNGHRVQKTGIPLDLSPQEVPGLKLRLLCRQAESFLLLHGKSCVGK